MLSFYRIGIEFSEIYRRLINRQKTGKSINYRDIGFSPRWIEVGDVMVGGDWPRLRNADT